MLSINFSYTYGQDRPIQFSDPKVGDRCVNIHLKEEATIIKVEDEFHFIIKYDNPKIHRERINIEGAGFRGLDAKVVPL